MRTQHGFAFLPLLAANWQIIAIGLLVAAVGGYVWHCESSKTEAAAFLGGVQALGKQAEKDASDAIQEHIARQEKANAENKVVRAALAVRTKQLRDARASGSFVSTPATATDGVGKARVNWPEFDRALRQFYDEAAGIVEEGDSARVDLDTTKKWDRD